MLIGQGSLTLMLQQSRQSHLSTVQLFEYGSPNDYPFPGTLLLKNWDVVLPAAVGVIALYR
jgi:hypothetical protein